MSLPIRPRVRRAPHDRIAAFGLALATTALAACAWAGSASFTDSTSIREVAPAPDPDEARLRLARAAAEHRIGNPQGVVDLLEPIDFSRPTFAMADRAAFLLGHAYLRSGSRARFVALARQVAAWPTRGPYTTWIQHQFTLAGDAAGQDSAGLPSEIDRTSELGRDLAGAEAIRRATEALARGEDPRPALESVAPGSRYAARAQHMLGLYGLERGQVQEGSRLLDSLLASERWYSDRREVLLALAGQALDAEQWEVAERRYREAEADWTQHREALDARLEGDQFDDLWRAWESHPGVWSGVVLDRSVADRLADLLAASSTHLSDEPQVPVPPFQGPAAGVPLEWPVAPPPLPEWRARSASAHAIDETLYVLARTQRDAARERARLAALRRYLAVGERRVDREAAELAAHAALLDSLRQHLGALDSLLQSVRDSATRRLVVRAARVIETGGRHLDWIQAMRHFHLEGPWRERRLTPPPGLPGPSDVLDREADLARTLLAIAHQIAAEVPDLLARSYAEAWRPACVDRALALDAEARALRRWAGHLAAAIDFSLLAHTTSVRLARLEARAGALMRTADSLRREHHALERRLARAAVERALESLAGEREAIDYGLAATGYALAVGLGTVEGASTRIDDPDDSREATWRPLATGRLERFLERYPRSFARGEMRFRLADLELMSARAEFRDRMVAYLSDQEAGRTTGAPPVLSYDSALALYRRILDEDLEFARRDAVLFNAGMILADGGDPEAADFFQSLVTTHPTSPYVQESWLRLGDLEFGARRFAVAIEHYERASAGSDTGLTAIARFKQGWSLFNEEHFVEAADAFRIVLDLYASAGRAAIPADIEAEAETYLMHALARAGGAEAFARYFDRIGERSYELRLLLALGQHWRRYSLYAEAAAADALVLARHPLDSSALLAAERMIDTHQRAERASEVRRARLEHAAAFAPGSPWSRAQSSDSLRAAGAAFARSAWLAVAGHHHQRARDRDDAKDWQEALRLYDQVLAIWPEDAHTLHLLAGEAAAELGDPVRALGHYEAATASSSDSVVAHALWQRLAVTDAWYGRTHPVGSTTSDSLARAVLEAGDHMLARVPAHPRAADVRWRQGNLAFAHGWFERAADAFGQMAERDSGDVRHPRAARLRADALLRLERFDEAGAAYEAARVAAARAGIDSLARQAEAAIPVCYFRHAEAAVAHDSTAYERHAARFERVASGWPAYEHAHRAQYRAGRAWIAAGSRARGIRSLEVVIRDFPESEYVRDARLEIAHAWEREGEVIRAAEAWGAFALHHPDDTDAGEAQLKSADLFDTAGLTGRADSTRLAYVEQHPDDHPTALEIFERLARRELDRLGADQPISTLMPEPKRTSRAAGERRAAAAAPLSSPLAEYLRRAAAHPEWASRDLIAEVRFRQGEEARTIYEATRLTQPLERSIPTRQRGLDSLVAAYNRSAELGIPKWSQASAFRIGEALVAFGVALETSERPADLTGDDLVAYEDVLYGQADAFHVRGEQVWTDLLRAERDRASAGEWVSRARTALWQRLAQRFFFMPEAEYPLTAADPVEHKRSPQ